LCEENNFIFSLKAQGNASPSLPTSTLSSFLPSTTSATKTSLSGSRGTTTLTSVSNSQPPAQGVDLSQAAAMANVRFLNLFFSHLAP
jgi:hypothetical protein